MSEIIPADRIETIKTLQAAWLAGELKYQRSLTYQGAPAKLGSVFYLIDYTTPGHIVYQGAYHMTLKLEEHLNLKNTLFAFLTFVLSSEL